MKGQGVSRKRIAPPTLPVGAAPPVRSDRVRRLFLISTAFLTGMAIMVLELAGNRILAPWFGNSLYTWTGLIGVVLVSLSAGYYLGGFLADRWPRYALLAHLLAGGALSTAAIPLLQSGLHESLNALDIIWGPVLATALLLALPSCLLAAVSPFAVRLISLLSADRQVGLSAGSVSMASTFGSVVGTFLAGFVFIPHLGLRSIVLGAGVVLAALALAGYALFVVRLGQRKANTAVAAAMFLSMTTFSALAVEDRPPGLVFEKLTYYHRIRVADERIDGQPCRSLYLDSTHEGAQVIASGEVVLSYQQFWQLSRTLTPDLQRAAFLGGGAFAMPEALLDAFPTAQADVLEIDPAVIAVGRRFFRVDLYPRLHPVAADARRFLATTAHRYDFIFGDAYNGVQYIPAHLVTAEFFQLVKQRLSEHGIYMMNIISAPQGPRSVFFQSVYQTLRQAFGTVDVYLDPQHLPPGETQNMILVASPGKMPAATPVPGPAVAALLGGKWNASQLDTSRGMVFRDDRNPVEYIIAKALLGG